MDVEICSRAVMVPTKGWRVSQEGLETTSQRKIWSYECNGCLGIGTLSGVLLASGKAESEVDQPADSFTGQS